MNDDLPMAAAFERMSYTDDDEPVLAWGDDRPARSGRWVRRAGGEPNPHVCAGPVAEHLGDLWRCRCGRLWRWARACDWCDSGGLGSHAGRTHAVGSMWRPATLGQRIRHWRQR